MKMKPMGDHLLLKAREQKENIVNCGYEKVCFKKYFAN